MLFVIRTAGNPLKSRPSRPLTVTTLAIVLVGLLLPFTPLAGALGFTPLPATYFVFLVAATSTYLLLVEFAQAAADAPDAGRLTVYHIPRNDEHDSRLFHHAARFRACHARLRRHGCAAAPRPSRAL